MINNILVLIIININLLITLNCNSEFCGVKVLMEGCEDDDFVPCFGLACACKDSYSEYSFLWVLRWFIRGVVVPPLDDNFASQTSHKTLSLFCSSLWKYFQTFVMIIWKIEYLLFNYSALTIRIIQIVFGN